MRYNENEHVKIHSRKRRVQHTLNTKNITRRPLAATRPRFVSELLDAQRHHLFVVRVINEIVVPDAIQQPR